MKKLISGAVLLLALPAVANVPYVLNEDQDSDQFKINHKKYINSNFQYLNTMHNDMSSTVSLLKTDVRDNGDAVDDNANNISINANAISANTQSISTNTSRTSANAVNATDAQARVMVLEAANLDDRLVVAETQAEQNESAVVVNAGNISNVVSETNANSDLIETNQDDIAELNAESLGEQLIDYQPTGAVAGDVVAMKLSYCNTVNNLDLTNSSNFCPRSKLLSVFAEINDAGAWGWYRDPWDAINMSVIDNPVSLNDVQQAITSYVNNIGEYSELIDYRDKTVETTRIDVMSVTGINIFGNALSSIAPENYEGRPNQTIKVNGHKVKIYKTCLAGKLYMSTPSELWKDGVGGPCTYIALAKFGEMDNVLLASMQYLDQFNILVNNLWIEQTE